MKNFLILLFVFPFFLFSQTKNLEKQKIETLMNNIYSDFISSDYKYYYLCKKKYTISEEIFFDEGIEFFKENKINIKELKTKFISEKDYNFSWSSYDLEKARKCTKDSLKISPRDFNPREYIYVTNKRYIKNRIISPDKFQVKVKKNWSKKKREIEANKQWNDYVENYKYEDNQCFHFSKPFFFHQENYALIVFKSKNETIYRIYSKEKDKWKKESDILKLYKH